MIGRGGGGGAVAVVMVCSCSCYCWRCRPEARLVMRSSSWPPRTLYVEAATQCNELSQANKLTAVSIRLLIKVVTKVV